MGYSDTAKDYLDDYIPPVLASGIVGAVEGAAAGGGPGAVIGWGKGLYEGQQAENQRHAKNTKDHPNLTGRPYGNQTDEGLQTIRASIIRSDVSGLLAGSGQSPNLTLADLRRTVRDSALADVDREIAGRKAGLFQWNVPMVNPADATMAQRTMFVQVDRPGPAAFPPVQVSSLQQLVLYAYDTVAEAGRMVRLMVSDPVSFATLLPEFLARQEERDHWRTGLRQNFVRGESVMLPAETMVKMIPVQTGAGAKGATQRTLPEFMSVADAIESYRTNRPLGMDLVRTMPRKVQETAKAGGGGAVAGVVTLGTVVALATLLK